MGSARRPGRKLVLREEAEGKDIVGGAGQRRARLEVGLAGKRRLDREGAGSDDDDVHAWSHPRRSPAGASASKAPLPLTGEPKNSTGYLRDHVMAVKRRHWFAPSTTAASYSSSGISWSAAKISSVGSGVICQTWTSSMSPTVNS